MASNDVKRHTSCSFGIRGHVESDLIPATYNAWFSKHASHTACFRQQKLSLIVYHEHKKGAVRWIGFGFGLALGSETRPCEKKRHNTQRGGSGRKAIPWCGHDNTHTTHEREQKPTQSREKERKIYQRLVRDQKKGKLQEWHCTE